MSNALIGYTGFVGSTLKTGGFDALFNSSNIAEIRGLTFDRVVCAGVHARKWWANQNPEEDLALIHGLLSHLAEISCKIFTLISTVDVYANPVGVTEADLPDETSLQPYGRHRLMVERFIQEHFARHRIVRLPGLFGVGLKKNIIYDLVNDNQLEKINPATEFQFYPTWRLPADLAAIEASPMSVVNIATEPIATEAILSRFFSDKTVGHPVEPAPRYDMWTIHPELLGGTGHYHLSQTQVLNDLGDYLGQFRKGVL